MVETETKNKSCSEHNLQVQVVVLKIHFLTVVTEEFQQSRKKKKEYSMRNKLIYICKILNMYI